MEWIKSNVVVYCVLRRSVFISLRFSWLLHWLVYPFVSIIPCFVLLLISFNVYVFAHPPHAICCCSRCLWLFPRSLTAYFSLFVFFCVLRCRCFYLISFSGLSARTISSSQANHSHHLRPDKWTPSPRTLISYHEMMEKWGKGSATGVHFTEILLTVW